MKPLTELRAWKALKAHADDIYLHRIDELKSATFASTPSVLQQKGIQLDFRHQRVNSTTLDLLIKLAEEQGLKSKIDALLLGEKVNVSEGRPALHAALRVMDETPIMLDGCDIVPDILATREKMRVISEAIRALKWYGYSDKPITDIVNIGIGGSDFGPRFCVDALSDFTAPHIGYHFISDADPRAFSNTVKTLSPETTLFIVSSKSFTTKETVMNAKKAIDWFGPVSHIERHFIAVTANKSQAELFGISHILPIWNWVGGRFSFCSAINLIGCIALGYDHFMDMLAGANHMDKHFQAAAFAENMPVMQALLGIWNVNFLHIPSLLLLVYARQLEKFVPYIQQLDMESNGKSIDIEKRSVNYATGPIVWGGMGNQAQHSYYQLLCQGSHQVAVDLISTQEFDDDMINRFRDAKMHVLSQGVHVDDCGYIPGKMPVNNISIASCTPFNLGLLIALYEHKTYVQGAIWNINVFDQPGVESAKRVSLTKTPLLA